MSTGLVIFFAAVLIVGGLLYLLIALTKKTGKPLDTEWYQAEWLKLQRQLGENRSENKALLVIEADKLVDRALRERGFRGATMGERMKSAQTTWKNANAVWAAHKLRNRVAHETNVEVSYELASRAMVAYKQALTDLRAI